jgi:hypothetical protein
VHGWQKNHLAIFELHTLTDTALKDLVMKASIQMMVVAALVLCQVGCQTQQKIAQNKAAAEAWLNQQSGASRIQVSGNWFAEGWGRSTLKQSGREITGTLDTYEIKGVVSGNQAYLTAWDSGKCYFAIILSQPSRNVLSGSYTDGPTYIAKAEQQRPVEFRRSY